MVKLFSGSSSAFISSMLLLILLSVCGQASAVTPPEPRYENSLIGDIRIHVKDFYGSEEQWIDMVQSLASTYIKKGDRFSSFEVTRLADALKACRRFRLIHLDTEMTETGSCTAYHRDTFQVDQTYPDPGNISPV